MSTPSSSPSQVPLKPHSGPRLLARAATWTVLLAAATLILTSLGSFFIQRKDLDAIAAEQLRLRVTGPARLQAGAVAVYQVTTSDVVGGPLPAQIELALYTPDGKRPLEQKESTDESGALQAAVPADMALPPQVQLKVVATRGQKREEVQATLAVEPVRYVTRVATDRPCYGAGESVSYRSLTVSRASLAADGPVPLRFHVVDPSGAVVPGSRHEVATERGVGQGTFALAADAAGGRYALVVHSPDGVFPDHAQPFTVRRAPQSVLRTNFEFLRAGYAPGDTVVADLAVHKADGPAAAGLSLHASATIDGQTVFQKEVQTDAAGRLRIEFRLPRNMELGEAQLAMTADEAGLHESWIERIPRSLGKLAVGFYPEGGELVEGLENRVYFAARDPLGKPVSIKGMIVDGRGANTAAVESTWQGMGSFTLIPHAGETYRLQVAEPKLGVENPELPPVSAERSIVLNAGAGVSSAAAPLEFNIRAAKANLPLVVVAWCRGMPVGQLTLVTKTSASGANPVSMPLDERAGGVLRLAVYDYGASPPRLVGERLVYRRPTRRLTVQAGKQDSPRGRGGKIDLSLLVVNEKAEPVPAVLGVAVVKDCPNADAAHGLVAPSLSTQLLLGDQLDRSAEFPGADFCLSDDKDAAVALDLLLATQGGSPAKPKEPQAAWPAAVSRLGPPPVMFDNLNDLRTRYEDRLANYRQTRTWALNIVITVSFFGGLGLLLAVVMLELLGVAWGIRLWLPALLAAACCVVVGYLVMDPARWHVVDSVAVPFAPFTAPLVAPSPSADQSPPGAERKTAAAPSPAAPGDVRRPAKKTAEAPETVLWQPLLIAGPDGRAVMHFELPDAEAMYRVRVDAHEDGRLGSTALDLPAQRSPRTAPSAQQPTPDVPAAPAPDKTYSYSGLLDAPQQVLVAVPEHSAPGSLTVTLHAFPSTLAQLQQACGGPLRQPAEGGQLLSSVYLNALSLEYVQEHAGIDPTTTRQIKESLQKGCAALGEYVAKPQGDERDPTLPACTVLTLQAVARVWDLDPALLEAAGQRVFDRRDGKGGFQNDPAGKHEPANGPERLTPEIINAYDAWALVESRRKGLDPETSAVIQSADKSADPYLIALAAITALTADREDRGRKLLEKLAEIQSADGHVGDGPDAGRPASSRLRSMETTALAALAWLKDSGYADRAGRAVEWMLSNRRPGGGFGSSRATVLALRAIVLGANHHKLAEGKVVVKRGDTLLAEQPFEAGRQETITVAGLASKLKPGNNKLSLTLTGSNNKMPYLLEVRYRSENR